MVLAERAGRDESKSQTLFANLYYAMVRKTALPNMPKTGFDVYLVDRKVIEVLMRLDEKNSALTGQILWSGFKTSEVRYHRLERKIGKRGKWREIKCEIGDKAEINDAAYVKKRKKAQRKTGLYRKRPAFLFNEG